MQKYALKIYILVFHFKRIYCTSLYIFITITLKYVSKINMQIS